MNRKNTQNRLNALYADWKERLQTSDQEFQDSFGAPLLLSVTENYCQSKIRLIVFGQETAGWSWNKNLKADYPRFSQNWPYQDIASMGDFVLNSDAVEGLCWAYQEFDFGSRMPTLRRTPFWQAFQEIRSWPDVGVMWSNIAISDYSAPGDDYSVLRAPKHIRETLATQQAILRQGELSILEPHACLFFTGPRYDWLISSTLPGCEFKQCGDRDVKGFARLTHPSLPTKSYRTYHPKYLSLGGFWNHIEVMRGLTCDSIKSGAGSSEVSLGRLSSQHPTQD